MLVNHLKSHNARSTGSGQMVAFLEQKRMTAYLNPSATLLLDFFRYHRIYVPLMRDTFVRFTRHIVFREPDYFKFF